MVADIAWAKHRSRDHETESRRDHQPGPRQKVKVVRPRIVIARSKKTEMLMSSASDIMRSAVLLYEIIAMPAMTASRMVIAPP